jgi:tetratricopeptide (TPR) repeat protein/DNA-binding XRE family transcriptional regulator
MTRPINAKYRTIVEAELAGAQLRVRFANGDVVKVPLKRVAPELRDRATAKVRSHGTYVEIQAGANTVELSWLNIRRITDRSFEQEFNRVSATERYEIGLKIREMRLTRGLTAREVAKAAGLSPQSLSRIENGRHDLVLSTLTKLLAAMGSSIEEFARQHESTSEQGNGDPPSRQKPAVSDTRNGSSVAPVSSRITNPTAAEIPAFYETVTDSEIAAEDIAATERLPDTDGETLPFVQLGGARFEILAYHLLSGDPLNPQSKVVLVKSSGDQGRDILVYADGSLRTIVQCKNLSSAVTKPQLLRELVKLVLHDIKTPFLPKSVKYEIWAPGGLSDPAEQLLAMWPKQLAVDGIRAVFDAVTNEYQRLKDVNWDESSELLLTTLRMKIKPWRQLNLDLTRRVRSNHDLHVRYFAANSVMPTEAVQAYFRQREESDESTRSAMFSVTTQATEALSTIQESLSKLRGPDASSDIDHDIDQARDRIRAGAADEGKVLLKRVQDNYGGQLTSYHRFRIASNLAFAVLQEGKVAEASQLFLQAVQWEPKNEHAQINEVLAYYLIRENRHAFDLASKLRKQYPASARLACFWVMTAQEDMQTADLADQVGPVLRADPDVVLALAQRAVQRDELELASGYAMSAKKVRPESSQSTYVLAQIELRRALPSLIGRVPKKGERLQHAENAISLATEALSLAQRERAKPAQVEILLVRCRGYLAQGKVAEASSDAASAMALLPGHQDALLALAESKLAEGKFQESAEAAEKLNETAVALPLRVMQAHALSATGADADLDKAIAILLEVTNLLPTPMRAPAAILAVKAMVRRKRFDVAVSYLRSLSGQIDSATELALKSAAEPDANLAVQIAVDSKSRCTEETHLETKDFLARTFMRLQRPGDALSLLQELYATESPAFDPRLLVECAFRLERHDIIMEVFDKLSGPPGRPWDEIEFEVQFLEKYDIPKAISRLTTFLRENPGHKIAQLRLSTIGVLHRRSELVRSSIADLPTVEELPSRYIRVATGVLSQGPDKAKTVDYAYRYLRIHFDELDAHQAMIQSVLATGSMAMPDVSLPEVVIGAAVQYQLQPGGELRWVVLEETEHPVRDFDEISPTDPRTTELLGKKVGDVFVVVKGSIRDTEGVIKQIMPKYLRRHHDCLAELAVRFPDSHVIESVVIEPADHPLQLGLAAVLASVQTRSQRVEETQKLYQTMPMSLHLYGAHFGKNAYEALMSIALTDKLAVKCAIGTSEEYQRATAALANASNIILDLSAIATVRLIGLTNVLKSNHYRFAMSDSTALEINETLGPEITEASEGGVLAFKDGEYRMYHESAEERKRRFERDQEFLTELHDHVATLSPIELASWSPEVRKSVTDFIGLYGAEAISLAKQTNTILWTDDVIEAQLGAGMFGTTGVWTQCVLARLADVGALTREDYVTATAKLVAFEYAGTYVDGAVFIECARQSQYDPEAAPLRQAIDIIASPQANPQVRFGMFRQLLNHLYSSDITPFRSGMVIRACLAALAQTPILWQQLMILRRNSQALFGLNVIAEQHFNRCFDAWTRGY